MIELDKLSNEDLECLLFREFYYYINNGNTYELCKIIGKQLSKKILYEIILKLYRIRHIEGEKRWLNKND